MKNINELSINTLRTLGIDAINKSKSGHPGIVLGAAPMAYTLFTKHLNITPTDSKWINRDRFVLAAGHGSMLLYSLLHLSGYKVSIEDLKNFRQYMSNTPGHPEYGHTDGVDATSGPLGQGIPMGVGMAIAERYLAGTFNKEDLDIFDHYTYVLCGDGDLMEGVTNEAISLAGHLGLGKLIVLYDSNDISLDGNLNRSFSENVINKFESLNWHVLKVENGTDVNDINEAIYKAKEVTDKPTLIEIKTIIGHGAPNEGTSKVHGAPIGEEGAVHAKSKYGWEYDPFTVPQEVYDHFDQTVKKRGEQQYNKWNKAIETYKENYPESYNELTDLLTGKFGVDFDSILPENEVGTSEATRSSSGNCINAIAEHTKLLIGGSADLFGSNKTYINNGGDFSRENYSGRNIWFGVREFAMGTIINGIQLHGGLRVFDSTFFVFSDYLKPSIRMAALMNLPVIHVFTHDSIAVGEDGPTHEPIEQLAMFRSLPNVQVLRPCDANETASAWRIALETTDKPTILVLSRQNLEILENTNYENVSKGAYVISEEKGKLNGILIATGSEVKLAIDAQKKLEEEGVYTRVISMPSREIFEKQPYSYRKEVLPKSCTNRMVIEMGSNLGWHKYAGDDGLILSIDTFGISAPGDKTIEHFGFTVDKVVNLFKLTYFKK